MTLKNRVLCTFICLLYRVAHYGFRTGFLPSFGTEGACGAHCH